MQGRLWNSQMDIKWLFQPSSQDTSPDQWVFDFINQWVNACCSYVPVVVECCSSDFHTFFSREITSNVFKKRVWETFLCPVQEGILKYLNLQQGKMRDLCSVIYCTLIPIQFVQNILSDCTESTEIWITESVQKYYQNLKTEK
jgi:hypothetical protein